MSRDNELKFRALSAAELELIHALLSVEFPGKSALQSQVASMTGREIDSDKSLALRVDDAAEPAQVLQRVPVEGELTDDDGMVISVLLHVVDGRMTELEILRGDSRPVKREISPAALLVTAR